MVQKNKFGFIKKCFSIQNYEKLIYQCSGSELYQNSCVHTSIKKESRMLVRKVTIENILFADLL